MTKGTKIFRIIVCTLLGLTMLCSLFFSALFVLYMDKAVLGAGFGVYVAGVEVTEHNEDDVLGDGTVSYNPVSNTLTLNNANIEHDYAIILSVIDLKIELIGENRFLCKDRNYITAIYVADGVLEKDLTLEGDGSLTIEFQNVTEDAQGILAQNLHITADINLIMPDCSNIVNAVICESSLYVGNKASLTVQNGSGVHSSAIRVRGNALFEEGTTVNVTVNPGTEKSCKGFSINGDLILGANVSLSVSMDDAAAEDSDCIRVTGIMDIGAGSTLSGEAKKAYGIECFGPIKLGKGASVTAEGAGEDVDIFCYGALVNCGATVKGEVVAIGGEHSK